MTTRCGPLFLALLISCIPVLVSPDCALAREPGTHWKSESSGMSASLHGSYRFRFGREDDILLAEDGALLEPGEWLYHRLRIDPTLKLGKRVRLVSQADLADGNLWGGTTDIAADQLLLPADRNTGLRSASLRKLYVEWDSPAGRFSVGRQTSRWGLGILANGGEEDGPFSDGRLGDIVERALFATTPLAPLVDGSFGKHFYIAGGADLVARDENADFAAGDRAWQGVGSLFYRDDALAAGFYGAWRTQTDRDETLRSAEPDGDSAIEVTLPGRTLDVWALDLFARYAGGSKEVKYDLGAEGVYVTGATTRGTNDNSPESVDVRQWGAAGQAGMSLPLIRLGVDLQIGYASPDRNNADAYATAFKFDPAYRAGMILFDDVLAWSSAYSAHRLADEGQRAVAPSGIRSIPTNGAVANAFYVAPVLAYKPVERVELLLGALWAAAPGGLVDPYLSQVKHGGAAVNPWGVPAGEWDGLGWEAEAGLTWRLPTGNSLDMRLAAQGGAFFPGDAFARGDGTRPEPIVKLRTMLDLKW